MSGKIKKSKENNESVFEKQRKRDTNAFLIETADTLIEQIRAVTFNGVTYVYDEENETYITGDGDIIKIVNKYFKLTSKQYRELLYQLNLSAPMAENSICFRLKNGTLIKNADGLYEFTKDKSMFAPFTLNVEYNDNANDEMVNKFLNDISSNNDEKKNSLIELIGSIFLVENTPCKIFYLYGPSGANGKSTFTSMLRNFFGQNLSSNIDIGGLQDDTNLNHLVGKLINISDDADFSILKYDKTSRMKSIASNETITFRPIYSYPITAKFFCTLIVSCNNLPLFDDKSGGLSRRLVILEFSMKLDKGERIPNMVELLSTENAKSTILNYAIQGMNQIIKNNYELTESEIVNKTMNDYYLETDNVRSFLKDTNIENQLVSEVYKQYERYCKDDISQEAVKKNLFGSRLKMYGYISKVTTTSQKGKKTSKRIYVKDKSKNYVSL